MSQRRRRYCSFLLILDGRWVLAHCVWRKDGNTVSQIPISDDNLYEEAYQDQKIKNVLTNYGKTVSIVYDAYFRLGYQDAEHRLYGFYGRMGWYGLSRLTLQEDGLHMKNLERMENCDDRDYAALCGDRKSTRLNSSH